MARKTPGWHHRTSTDAASMRDDLRRLKITDLHQIQNMKKNKKFCRRGYLYDRRVHSYFHGLRDCTVFFFLLYMKSDRKFLKANCQPSEYVPIQFWIPLLLSHLRIKKKNRGFRKKPPWIRHLYRSMGIKLVICCIADQWGLLLVNERGKSRKQNGLLEPSIVFLIVFWGKKLNGRKEEEALNDTRDSCKARC